MGFRPTNGKEALAICTAILEINKCLVFKHDKFRHSLSLGKTYRSTLTAITITRNNYT